METPAVPDAVIVIDDDYAMRLSCDQILARSGYRVETFEDGARGLDAVAACKPGLVLVDLKMPGLSGTEVIARLHEVDPTITVVVITGYATISTAVEAMKAGAYDFLPKPFSPEELRLIVRRGFERRELQIEARHAAVERELQRRRFVTFVTHQLKTPLVAVHQFLDLIQRLGDTPDAAAKRSEWLARCLARTEELQRLIEEWLTLARLEGGTLGSQRVRVDVRPLISAVLANDQPLAASREVSLSEELPGESCPVHGDPICLAMLLDNLVTNAIQYNRPGGRVCVRASRSPGEIVVAVEDTGSGIPRDALPFLFDEFFRVRRPGARQTSGTGLGLHICRRIVTEMGGTIEVESTEGTGSMFRARLPVFAEDAPSTAAPARNEHAT
jgi:two-component system sensor histidine kinase/response regulator